jgi:PIN domain nuclease of toxin-antitoxin system
MTLLLDTQIFLWMQLAPRRLSEVARRVILDPENIRLLSIASAWESAIKFGQGKLALPDPPEQYFPARMRLAVCEWLPIREEHVYHVATLPRHHTDPFDRLLIAQSQIEGIPIITADPVFERYGVRVIRA